MGGDIDGRTEPGLSNPSTPPRCAGSEGPIGVLEAAWLENPDGTLRPSSVRNIDADALAGAQTPLSRPRRQAGAGRRLREARSSTTSVAAAAAASSQ